MPSKTKKSRKKQSFSKQEVDIAVKEIEKKNEEIEKKLPETEKEKLKEMTNNIQEKMIKYKEEGRFEEFMKDVCHINEEQIINLFTY